MNGKGDKWRKGTDFKKYWSSKVWKNLEKEKKTQPKKNGFRS